MSLSVSIFAASSPFDSARFEAGLSLLRQLGFTVRVPDATRRRQGFLAGDDPHRVDAFRSAWLDPSIDVMMAARGGYGAHRILPDLENLPDSPNRKLLVGFSDVCAIHGWLQRRGIPSIHGPVVTQLGDLSPIDLDRLRAVLTESWSGLIYSSDGPTLRPGVAQGKLTGGCLSVLTPMLGTPYAPSMDGCILLLEDVAEPPYRIDRLLTHMRLSGALAGVTGVAIGDFVGGHARREGEPDATEVLRERLHDLGVPVLAGLPFGHGKRNQAMPLGATARLDADRRELVIEGP